MRRRLVLLLGLVVVLVFGVAGVASAYTTTLSYVLPALTPTSSTYYNPGCGWSYAFGSTFPITFTSDGEVKRIVWVYADATGYRGGSYFVAPERNASPAWSNNGINGANEPGVPYTTSAAGGTVYIPPNSPKPNNEQALAYLENAANSYWRIDYMDGTHGVGQIGGPPSGLVVTDAQPDPGVQGKNVLITGTGFNATKGTGRVEIVGPNDWPEPDTTVLTTSAWGDESITAVVPANQPTGEYYLYVYNSDAESDSIEWEVASESGGLFSGLQDFMQGLVIPSENWSFTWQAIWDDAATRFPFSMINALILIRTGFYASNGGNIPSGGTPSLSFWGQSVHVNPPAWWGPTRWAWRCIVAVIWLSALVGFYKRFMPLVKA